MCGIKSKVLLCGLALLLFLCAPLYSEANYYQITEEELTELENILETQASKISEQQRLLTELNQIIEKQANSINALGQSLTEYERAATAQSIRIGAISFGIGVGVGAILIAVLN